jgi:predicted thioesterase
LTGKSELLKNSIKPGIEHSATYEVDPQMKPPHLPIVVLSTPTMIGMIETTCASAIQGFLDEGETTMGTRVSVTHVGPAFEGEEVRVWCRLKEIDKRRLRYEVEVYSPRGSISTGSHELAVVNLRRFREKMKMKEQDAR